MDRIWKYLAIGIPSIGLMIGCAGTTHDEATAQAYDRWNGARASLVLGVGEEQFRTGDLDNAGNSAREALALSPELTNAHILLARVHIEQGRYLDAQTSLTLAEQIEPENPQVAYLSGVVHEKRGEYMAALTAYEKARALDGENGAYVMASAEVLVSLERPGEALRLIESKLGVLDQTYGLTIAAGKLAMMVGEYDRAVEHFCAARAISEDQDTDVLVGLGQAYFRAERYREAVYALNELRTIDNYEQRAWVHVMLGDCYLAQDRPREARPAFERATEIEPRVARNWVGLAKSAMANNDPQRTILSSQEALRLDPQNLDGAILLAGALISADRPAQARDVLTDACRRHPEEAILKMLMARSLSLLGEPEQARLWYESAVSVADDEPMTRRLLANAAETTTP